MTRSPPPEEQQAEPQAEPALALRDAPIQDVEQCYTCLSREEDGNRLVKKACPGSVPVHAKSLRQVFHEEIEPAPKIPRSSDEEPPAGGASAGGAGARCVGPNAPVHRDAPLQDDETSYIYLGYDKNGIRLVKTACRCSMPVHAECLKQWIKASTNDEGDVCIYSQDECSACKGQLDINALDRVSKVNHRELNARRSCQPSSPATAARSRKAPRNLQPDVRHRLDNPRTRTSNEAYRINASPRGNGGHTAPDDAARGEASGQRGLQQPDTTDSSHSTSVRPMYETDRNLSSRDNAAEPTRMIRHAARHPAPRRHNRHTECHTRGCCDPDTRRRRAWTHGNSASEHTISARSTTPSTCQHTPSMRRTARPTCQHAPTTAAPPRMRRHAGRRTARVSSSRPSKRSDAGESATRH